eukprot:COSAG06_NODE_1013_length_11079_cov_7.729053_4_plen_72_part_00
MSPLATSARVAVAIVLPEIVESVLRVGRGRGGRGQGAGGSGAGGSVAGAVGQGAGGSVAVLSIRQKVAIDR